MTAVLRSEERVTPLELFFDLVFVLALTQCTALMADEPDWEGLGKGLLVLGVMWWSWVGYAWLTSVVDPEEGVVRFAIFAAMAALLVVALCVPEAFGDAGLLFAVRLRGRPLRADRAVRVASRDDPALRRSVIGLAGGHGARLRAPDRGARSRTGCSRARSGPLALLLDMRGPYLFGSEGWKLVPGHFAERHGLIIIIALGESIVAIGVGAEAGVDAGVVGGGRARHRDRRRAVVALLRRRGAGGRAAAPQRRRGPEQNEIARDSFSYLHFPMVAGIVLLALGLKKTLEHVDEPLKLGPAVAVLGGTAALPARPRRLPLAQRAPLQLAAPALRRRTLRADPGGGRGRRRS